MAKLPLLRDLSAWRAVPVMMVLPGVLLVLLILPVRESMWLGKLVGGSK